MIVNFQELRKQNKEKEFDLGEAIRNDEVDLVFGITEELINEYYELSDGKMVIMIRNKTEDRIQHNFTMKFIPNDKSRRKDPAFNYDGHYGLPISFKRNSKDWYINIGK